MSLPLVSITENRWTRAPAMLRAYCLAWAWMREGRHHTLATPAERAEIERLHPPNDTQADGAYS